jgi:hypothetical protein
MIRTIALGLGVAGALPLRAAAAPADELDRFAGVWQSQGTFLDTPYSKAGTSSALTTCNWSRDRLFMICQQAVTMNGKTEGDLGIYTYDDASAAYNFYNVRTSRITSTAITVDGNTITYPLSFNDKGKNVMIRTVNVWKNSAVYTWRTEFSTDGGANWTLMSSGASQKQ